jgi:hypothetical protein
VKADVLCSSPEIEEVIFGVKERRLSRGRSASDAQQAYPLQHRPGTIRPRARHSGSLTESHLTQFNGSSGFNETGAAPMSCTCEDILAELVTIGQPISSKSIADRLGKPYYTVSALLSKLYFRGVIGRMTLPDYRRGRAYLYYAKGRPAVASL